jgi:NtrC-family two-component system response regulator AlgB
VITFTLPPLRERTRDILPFAEWMLKRMSSAASQRELVLSPAASEALVSYRWPGNVRELHNALEHAAALSRTHTITFDDLPDSVRHPASGMFVRRAHGTRLKDFEREHILRVLGESSTLEQAAATLGINVTTLWRKRRYYGIGSKRAASAASGHCHGQSIAHASWWGMGRVRLADAQWRLATEPRRKG